MVVRDPDAASRRQVLGASALGISAVVLPSAAVAASTVSVSGWSTTLSFSEVTTDGFTVTWTPVA